MKLSLNIFETIIYTLLTPVCMFIPFFTFYLVFDFFFFFYYQGVNVVHSSRYVHSRIKKSTFHLDFRLKFIKFDQIPDNQILFFSYTFLILYFILHFFSCLIFYILLFLHDYLNSVTCQCAAVCQVIHQCACVAMIPTAKQVQ